MFILTKFRSQLNKKKVKKMYFRFFLRLHYKHESLIEQVDELFHVMTRFYDWVIVVEVLLLNNSHKLFVIVLHLDNLLNTFEQLM